MTAYYKKLLRLKKPHPTPHKNIFLGRDGPHETSIYPNFLGSCVSSCTIFLWNLNRRKKLKCETARKNFYLDCRLHFVNPCVTAKRFLWSEAICSNLLECFSIHLMSLSMHCCLKNIGRWGSYQQEVRRPRRTNNKR